MSDRLRIATLNIWNKSGPWPERLRLIRSELGQLAPDVLGLQEVLKASDGDQASEIGEGFGYEQAYAPAADYGNGLLFGNALLSRHPIRDAQTFALPGVESGETRSLLYARVETPHGELPVFVTHLNWKLHHGSVRLSQVRFIAEKLRELAPIDDRHLPPVLMGDMNAEPGSDEIRYLTGLATIEGRSFYLADAWVYGGDGSQGATFDRKNHYAALAHEPPRRIDYIFVRGPDRKLRGEPLETRLAFATPEGDVWPSDHFGLVTEIAAVSRTGKH